MLVDTFDRFDEEMLEKYFPLQEIRISQFDKPWITEEMKILRRKKQRIYEKKGKCPEYKALHERFNEKKKKEIENKRLKILSMLKEGKTNDVYKALRKLGTDEENTHDFPVPLLE